jgi:hypothetical protein
LLASAPLMRIAVKRCIDLLCTSLARLAVKRCGSVGQINASAGASKRGHDQARQPDNRPAREDKALAHAATPQLT